MEQYKKNSLTLMIGTFSLVMAVVKIGGIALFAMARSAGPHRRKQRCADADQPGQDHAMTVAAQLERITDPDARNWWSCAMQPRNWQAASTRGSLAIEQRGNA